MLNLVVRKETARLLKVNSEVLLYMCIRIYLKCLFILPGFNQKWNVVVKISSRKCYNWFVFCVIACVNWALFYQCILINYFSHLLCMSVCVCIYICILTFRNLASLYIGRA